MFAVQHVVLPAHLAPQAEPRLHTGLSVVRTHTQPKQPRSLNQIWHRIVSGRKRSSRTVGVVSARAQHTVIAGLRRAFCKNGNVLHCGFLYAVVDVETKPEGKKKRKEGIRNSNDSNSTEIKTGEKQEEGEKGVGKARATPRRKKKKHVNEENSSVTFFLFHLVNAERKRNGKGTKLCFLSLMGVSSAWRLRSRCTRTHLCVCVCAGLALVRWEHNEQQVAFLGIPKHM